MSILFALCLLWMTGPDPAPVVEWLEPTEFDFGELSNTDEVKTTFSYRNISDKPIIIEAVRPGCGCTLPNWSEEPVMPDSIGTLEVLYHPKGPGYFRELVKVYFNTQRKAEKLYVEGEVVE